MFILFLRKKLKVKRAIILGLLFLLIIVCLFIARQISASWTKTDPLVVGSELLFSTAGNSTEAKIVSTSSGVPIIAWNDYTTGSGDIYVSKFTEGIGWTQMDGATSGYDNISATSGASYGANLKINSSNTPFVVWRDGQTGNGDIYISKYAIGTGWTKMDGSTLGYDNVSDNSSASSSADFALVSESYPYVVWSDGSEGSTEIYFSRWSGTAWVKMNGSSGYDNISNMNGNSEEPKIVIDSLNYPQVVWQDYNTGNFEINYSRWNGSTWTGADGVDDDSNSATFDRDKIATTSGRSDHPKIQLDSNNKPYVCWDDLTTGTSDIYCSHWVSGSTWSKMDNTSGYNNVSDNASASNNNYFMLTKQNDPYLVWADTSSGTIFSRWNGSTWTGADGVDDDSNPATFDADLLESSLSVDDGDYPQLILSSSDNPYVVWTSNMVKISKWNGSTWTGINGIDSDSDPDTFDNDELESDWFANTPSFYLNPTNFPYVAWSQGMPGSHDIYFSRWHQINNNNVDISASVEPSLSVNLSSADIALGTFSSTNISTSYYDTTISTNSSSGYIAYIKADGKLRNAANDINDVSGGTVDDGTEAYGVATTKASQAISRINDANSDTFYTSADCEALNNGTTPINASAVATTDLQYASASGSVSNDVTSLCFAVSIAGSTPAGSFQQIIYVTVISNF